MLRLKGTKIEIDIPISQLCQVAYNAACLTPIRGSAHGSDWTRIVKAILDKLGIEVINDMLERYYPIPR